MSSLTEEKMVQKEAHLRKPTSGVAEASSPGLLSEMIERAAKAIVQFMIDDDPLTTSWDDASPEMQDEMRRVATAALTAALGDTHVMVPRGKVSSERQRCAKIAQETLNARARYFDQAKGHRDWGDAARSYRASANEVATAILAATGHSQG